MEKKDLHPNIPFAIQGLLLVKEKPKGSTGIIECPKCKGKPHFGRASNGHTRGKCETEDCIS